MDWVSPVIGTLVGLSGAYWALATRNALRQQPNLDEVLQCGLWALAALAVWFGFA